MATPLAVVLAELLQNAVEHAFSIGREDGGRPSGLGPRPVGHIQVDLSATIGLLRVEVLDDGSGLPEGFDIDDTQSLGLSIVRDLVRSQLDGTITMRDRSSGPPGARAPGGHRAAGAGAAADRPVAAAAG